MMTAVKLVSPSQRLLQPLIEAALNHELRLMEVGISQTQQRLRAFEEKYHMPTADFIVAYENDQFDETMDFIEWIGESRLLHRLREKADT
jgi:hypothetical protein